MRTRWVWTWALVLALGWLGAGALRLAGTTSLPRAEPFIRMPFGEGETQLAPSAVIDLYLQVRPLTVTGLVTFNERNEACIDDYRGKVGGPPPVEWLRFFDAQGRLARTWKRPGPEASQATVLALDPEGKLWSEVRHADYWTGCVWKVDPTRGVLFEFGEPAPGAWRVRRNQQLIGRTVSAAERRRLAREFRHRWGVGYQLPDRIQSLFADGAGRVYLLTELKSLHVFDVRGQPLARYHYNWDEHFLAREAAGLREAERLEGPVIYVDFDGRIYTQQVHWEAQDAQGRFPQTLNVYEWSPRVRRVFSAPLPESGCVVGVDGRGAVYYLEFERRRVYRIGREGESRLVFSPREHYADWVRREREAWLAEHPERREAADRYPGMGPRVGHVCHVDREGHLYLTLVGAKEFRIDRIRLDP